MGPLFLIWGKLAKTERQYSKCKLQNFGMLHDFKEILFGEWNPYSVPMNTEKTP